MRSHTCTHIVKATIEKMRVTTRDSSLKPAQLLALSCHAQFFRARDSGFWCLHATIPPSGWTDSTKSGASRCSAGQMTVAAVAAHAGTTARQTP